MSRLTYPSDLFHLREGEKPMYGESPYSRRAVEYFKSFMTADEWVLKRAAVAKQFYESLIGESSDPSGKGKYFDDRDLFAWYLFLAESFTDHPWNYEVIYGCRVMPIFASIGADLDILLKIDGFKEKAARIVGPDKSQPNGPLFEILVAAAYAKAGATVSFRKEQPGQGRSYDIDVELRGKKWAIECKRMESGEYHERERLRMRELWKLPCFLLVKDKHDAILDISFKVEIKDVPEDYLLSKVRKFLGRSLSCHFWSDSVSKGSVENLDLRPIQEALNENFLLHPSPQFTRLLTGSYQRSDSMLSVMAVKYSSSPHYIDEIGGAALCRWKSISELAIEKKARDILGKLAEANSQLPINVAGVVHIGFEALGNDEIEQRRYEKIIATARGFERGNSQLETIYCHYFAPDPAGKEVWAIDETDQWIGIGPLNPKQMHLLPMDDGGRSGVFWNKPAS